jgi:branched-chain amino acid transport system substrate-binding protein
MAYIGTPLVYNSLSPETGANYSFVSCFTPGSTDESPGVKQMSEFADKYGHTAMKDDINYVSGWVTGQLVTDAVKAAGPDVTREKLVAMLNKGFSIDTKGLSAPISYTPESHLGLVELKPFSYDYTTKRFVGTGSYADYAHFVQ